MSNVTATGHLRGFARLPLEAGRRRSPLGWRSLDAVRSVAEPDAELIPAGLRHSSRRRVGSASPACVYVRAVVCFCVRVCIYSALLVFAFVSCFDVGSCFVLLYFFLKCLVGLVTVGLVAMHGARGRRCVVALAPMAIASVSH